MPSLLLQRPFVRLKLWLQERRRLAAEARTLLGPDFSQALTIAVLAGLSSTYAAAADIARMPGPVVPPAATVLRHAWQPDSETARAVTGWMIFDGGLMFENGTRMQLAIAHPLAESTPTTAPSDWKADTPLPLGEFLVTSNADAPLQNGNSLACVPGEPILVSLVARPPTLVLRVYPARPTGTAELFEASTPQPCGVYSYRRHATN